MARCRAQETQAIAVFTHADQGDPDPASSVPRPAVELSGRPGQQPDRGRHRRTRELIAANALSEDALRIVPDSISGGQLVVLWFH